MNKIEAKSSTNITFTIQLTLTLEEAIVSYGTKPFLEAVEKFFSKMYLQPYEKGVISLFKTIEENLPVQTSKIIKAKEAINKALKDF